MPTATELGQAGLKGWREKLADGVAQPVAKRTGTNEEAVRSVIGAAFFILALIYVARTATTLARRARH